MGGNNSHVIITPVGKASREKRGSINEALVNQGRHKKELNPSLDSPSKGSLQKTSSKAAFLLMLVIILVSFAVYFNTLFNGFVYDDMMQILQNHWIKDVRYLLDIISKPAWGFRGEHVVSNYYRPMMNIIYMFNICPSQELCWQIWVLRSSRAMAFRLR